MKTVLEGAKGKYALDLYAGVGFFTLPLAKRFERVVSVDANLAATRDLQANAEAAGVQVVSNNEHTEEFLKKEQETPRVCGAGSAAVGIGSGRGGATGESGRYRNCLSFVRPVDVGKRLGSADWIGAKTDKRGSGGAPLRN